MNSRRRYGGACLIVAAGLSIAGFGTNSEARLEVRVQTPSSSSSTNSGDARLEFRASSGDSRGSDSSELGFEAMDSNTEYTTVFDPDASTSLWDTIRNTKVYGFWDGARDGFFFSIDGLLTLFGVKGTLAADGGGIASNPTNTGYWVAYYLLAGGPATALGFGFRKR
jgi:hypothetical protein